jgi:zinc protease
MTTRIAPPRLADAPATRRLDNGLVLYAASARHAPVVSLWVWYHVGGRNEVPGTTGMSHFLEHMLFKGTPAHPKGDLDRLLARYGAVWNAFTNEDVTCYFETVPKERYETALELEADRMRHALIDPAETEAERTVIVSEREGLENDPSFLLGEELVSIAFTRHTYGQGVIGSKEEIQTMPRDGLYEHYRRFYAPSNAYVVVVGDDEEDALLDKAAEAFAKLEAGAAAPAVRAPEPPQHGEKRVTVRRAGGALPLVQLAFKTPRATDPSTPALHALAVALAGASGGAQESASGRSSRLYRALVASGLATEVEASAGLNKDPYLFWVEASLLPDGDHRAVEDRILGELERMAAEPLPADEFARVRKGLLAGNAFPSDTVTGRAFRLGQLLSTGAASSIGDWYDRLAAVTADDIRAAAAATFSERSRTVGWFIPE